MSEFQVLIVNMLFYIALFTFCIYRYKIRNLSVALSLLYMINSICGVLLFLHPLYAIIHPASNGTCTMQASIFLFGANLIFILAFNKCDISQLRKLKDFNPEILGKVQKFLCVCYIIYLFFQLPQSINFFLSSDYLDDLRQLTYSESLYSNNIVVSNIHKFFSGSLLILLVIVAVKYCFFRKFGFWDKLSIIVYFLMKLSAALGWVSRVAVVFSLIEIGFVYLLFIHYIPKHMNKKILIYIFTISIPAFFFMSAISFARFGNREIGKESYSFLLYSGESQLNFMALPWNYLKEPFYGYHYYPIFRKYLGLDYPQEKTRDGATGYDLDTQKKFHYYQPTYIFHGTTGQFLFDWGKVGVYVIAILFYLLMQRAWKNKRKISFMAIVSVIFLASFIGKGVFYFDYGNKAGNFMVIFMFILYFILRINGKEYRILNS